MHKRPADARKGPALDWSVVRPFTLIIMLQVRYFLIKIIILVTSRCHVKEPRCLSLLKDEAYARSVLSLGKGSVKCAYSSEILLQAGLVGSFASRLFSSSSSSIPKICAEAKTSKGTSKGVAALTKKSRQRWINLLSSVPRWNECYVARATYVPSAFDDSENLSRRVVNFYQWESIYLHKLRTKKIMQKDRTYLNIICNFLLYKVDN